jgi:hypothetical protein
MAWMNNIIAVVMLTITFGLCAGKSGLFQLIFVCVVVALIVINV